uniref:C2H2-type domain-containing protein n=1 Tax=Clytia hemisphaerica TaxID=252671 RepID=A0A7M5V206_9CNID
FECQECGKTFGQKTNLTSHQRTVHHGIKAFECQECAKCFGQKTHLTFHQKTVHPSKNRQTDKNFTGLWTDLTIEQTLMRTIKSRSGLTRGRGMTESVRHQWVLSLNQMATIHDAMMQLSKAQTTSSAQHIESGNNNKNFGEGGEKTVTVTITRKWNRKKKNI